MPTVASLEIEVKKLDSEIKELKSRVDGLIDKLDVVEEHTCENYNALTELNEWKDKVDDQLEDY